MPPAKGKDAQPDRQPIEMSELISVPIAALMRSQLAGQLEAMEQFIESSFDAVRTSKGMVLKPKQLVFDYEHQVADPSSPGEMITRSARVSAPIAALLRPVPLTIDGAELEYRFAISGVSEAAPAPKPASTPTLNLPANAPSAFASALREALPTFKSPATRFTAAFTTNNPAASAATPTVNIKVTLKARSSSEGLARLEQLLADSIAARVDSDEKENKPGS